MLGKFILQSRDDFEAVVESLYTAIRGQKVDKGVLQTEDTALSQAYEIVTQGVRRDGGFSEGVFELDAQGAVAGHGVVDHDFGWRVCDNRYRCALFGASPAESE